MEKILYIILWSVCVLCESRILLLTSNTWFRQHKHGRSLVNNWLAICSQMYQRSLDFGQCLADFSPKLYHHHNPVELFTCIVFESIRGSRNIHYHFGNLAEFVCTYSVLIAAVTPEFPLWGINKKIILSHLSSFVTFLLL